MPDNATPAPELNPQSLLSDPPSSPVNPWQLAEEGWGDLLRAAAKIQAAADAIKKTDRSVEGYNIERSLNKHKPDLMPKHLENLRDHRKTNKL